MTRHIFKLIWNRKGQHIFLILEVFAVFLILYGVSVFATFNLERYREPLGFDTQPIWTAYFSLPQETDSALIADTRHRLKISLESLPEVEKVAFSGGITPFSGSNWINTNNDMGFQIQSWMSDADAYYAETMGMKMLAGRWFSEADYQDKYTPVVVNQRFIDSYFPDTNMVGQVLRFGGEKRIVGVVERYKYLGEFAEDHPLIITPYYPWYAEGLTLMIRVKPGTGPDLEEKLSRQIGDIARGWDFSIVSLETRRQRDSQEIWAPMVAMFAICGFLIVNVGLGLFGVLMYSINRRRPEIGLRLAVGASPTRIVRQFFAEFLLIALLGMGVGLLLVVQLPLLDVLPVPSRVYLVAGLFSVAVIVGLVVLCTLYPSYIASQIQPATALHEE
ncbi:MAG: FtsX-like permease family protein [Bacteroidia bacterium]